MQFSFLEKIRPLDHVQWENLVHRMQERTKTYASQAVHTAQHLNLLEFGILKVGVLSFGLLLGAQFNQFFKKHRLLLVIAFITCWFYLIWRTFMQKDKAS